MTINNSLQTFRIVAFCSHRLFRIYLNTEISTFDHFILHNFQFHYFSIHLSSKPNRLHLSSQPNMVQLSSRQTGYIYLSSHPSKVHLSSQPSRVHLSSQPSRVHLSSQPSRVHLTGCQGSFGSQTGFIYHYSLTRLDMLCKQHNHSDTSEENYHH